MLSSYLEAKIGNGEELCHHGNFIVLRSLFPFFSIHNTHFCKAHCRILNKKSSFVDVYGCFVILRNCVHVILVVVERDFLLQFLKLFSYVYALFFLYKRKKKKKTLLFYFTNLLTRSSPIKKKKKTRFFYGRIGNNSTFSGCANACTASPFRS